MLPRCALAYILATLLTAAGCSKLGHREEASEAVHAASTDEAIRLARRLGTPTRYEAKEAASGLTYIDVKIGDGHSPIPASSTVWIHYTAWTDDGTKFDSSIDRGIPVRFSLGTTTVIEGLREGIAEMQVGGIRKVIIPPQLGYMGEGVGARLAANATLILEIHLLGVMEEWYPHEVVGAMFHSEYLGMSLTRGALAARRGEPLVFSKHGFFAQGTLKDVDQCLGRWCTGTAGGEGLSGIGPGLATYYWHLGVTDHLYEDPMGVRLVASDKFFMDTLILTKVAGLQGYAVDLNRSRRVTAEPSIANPEPQGYPVDLDLASVRTQSGIGLGDTQGRVSRLAGDPSLKDRYRGYEIWWYLGKPEQEVTSTGRPYLTGHAAAYVFDDSRLVEIWLHAWDTEPRG